VKLSLFLTDLLHGGNVVVPRTISPIAGDDLDASLVLLQELYDQDVLNMPFGPPAFDSNTAVWAAEYIFYVCQLILLRDVDELQLQNYLKAFEGEQSATAIYSADLLLRFLPDLFRLSSGLSPEDPLVANLKQTAITWPYSSIGLKEVAVEIPIEILNNECLRLSYIDRIIQCKDISRLKGIQEKELLKEVLGDHQSSLWPGLELLNI
jgi:MoxR-vWA-beta-propeller ternary system domain bpX4